MKIEDLLLVETARRDAELAHAGTTRKKSDSPYVMHPHRVALRVAMAGGSPAAVAAAEAHDIKEDVPGYDLSHLPARVHELIDLVTRDKAKETKPEFIERTFGANDKEAALIKVSDRIDNLEEGVTTLGRDWYLKGYRDTSIQIHRLASNVLGKNNLLVKLLRHRIDEADKLFGV